MENGNLKWDIKLEIKYWLYKGNTNRTKDKEMLSVEIKCDMAVWLASRHDVEE